MKSLKIFVNGTVQGVFFRKHIKDCADELNIKGFVRNLEDGRVEILAEGTFENIQKFVDKCKQGSPHSDIKEIQIEEIFHQGFRDFKILRV